MEGAAPRAMQQLCAFGAARAGARPGAAWPKPPAACAARHSPPRPAPLTPAPRATRLHVTRVTRRTTTRSCLSAGPRTTTASSAPTKRCAPCVCPAGRPACVSAHRRRTRRTRPAWSSPTRRPTRTPTQTRSARLGPAAAQLALRLHPDKNKAHRAEDAFKAVSRAFSCLSDPDKRAHYDRTGFESHGDAAAVARTRGGGGYGARGGGGFGGGPFGPMGGMYYSSSDEIDPEEIFNMFFG